MRPKVTVITDLSFGSVGKGSVAEYYSRNIVKPDVIAVGFSSNAGHSSYTFGRKMVHSVIPNGLNSDNLKRIMIGPGAIIDVNKLDTELEDVPDNIFVYIHEAACVINSDAVEEDAALVKIGSTMKGCGSAAIQKLRRDEEKSPLVRDNYEEMLSVMISWGRVQVLPTQQYAGVMMQSEHILVEGHQGFSLGPNQGFWPYCTFRECTTYQLLVDAGVPAACELVDVIGVARTFPIRVANRHDDEGNMIGTSGPCYDDQAELSWAEIGREPEKTTVTQLERRVFSFSWDQFRQACVANGCTKTVLTFADYLPGDTHLEFLQKFTEESEYVGAVFDYATYGYTEDSDYVRQSAMGVDHHGV
jgi:adenylosuccinate synthase